MALEPSDYQLPARAQRKLAELLSEGEKVLWSGPQVPSHAWTMVGTTFPRSLWGRAISLVAYEACGAVIGLVGLVLFAFFVETLLGYPWTIPEFIGMVLVAPASVFVIGGSLQIMYLPLLIVRVARDVSFVLTTRTAFIFDASGEEVEVKGYDLATAYEPDVYRLSATGIGDVVFAFSTAELVGGDSDTSTAFFDLGFFAVADAQEVARRINQARIAIQGEL